MTTDLSAMASFQGSLTWSNSTARFIDEFARIHEVLFAVNSALLTASLLGNITVIFFICAQKKARTTPNITMVSIAMADILTAAFVIPSHFAIMQHNTAQHNIMCKLHIYVWCWCKTSTIYSIVAMICDRYNRFFKPFKSNQNMSGRFMFFLSFIWFFGAAYNIWEIVLNASSVQLVQLPDLSLNVTLRGCGSSQRFQYLYHGFLVMDILVIFIFPFIIVSFFFSSISHDVLHPDDRVTRQRVSTGKRRMVLSVTIFCLFYACQLPYEILDAVTYFSNALPPKFNATSEIFKTISFSQGLFNALAYFSCSPELHNVIRRFYHQQQLARASSPPLMANPMPLPEIVLTNDEMGQN